MSRIITTYKHNYNMIKHTCIWEVVRNVKQDFQYIVNCILHGIRCVFNNTKQTLVYLKNRNTRIINSKHALTPFATFSLKPLI